MIFDTEKWQEIFRTLAQHKLRTSLTAFGVFWGIFMLTMLLGTGKGLENGVYDDFPPVANVVWIWTRGTTQIPYEGMAVGREIELESRDIAAVENNVFSVEFIRGENSVGIWGGTPPFVQYKDKNGSFYVQGTHAGMEIINGLKIIEGRRFNEMDDQSKRKVALLGTGVSDQLFGPKGNPVGKSITISGIRFTVIGVFGSSTSDNQRQKKETIFIPNSTLRFAFNQVGWVGNIVVQPKPGIHAQQAEQDVIRYLSGVKKVSPEDTGVFGSYNLQNEYDKVKALFAGVKTFSWLVAIGTIMAGAIGVGNIMLIVVKERTREIGLRKALGATPNSIVAMIVSESILITAGAGYLGLVVGVILIEGINRLLLMEGGAVDMFKRPEVDFTTAISALVVLVISGLLASALPAAQAAAINPIVALQDK